MACRRGHSQAGAPVSTSISPTAKTFPYDDYAHHPSELHALLEMAKSLDYRRVVCVFQPHTYTRTKALFDDFVRELKAADLVVLTDIYAAREKNTVGISSQDLAERIPGALYRPSLPSAAVRFWAWQSAP